MPSKTATNAKRVLDTAVDPDDVLSRKESALVAKARREMREGKSVTLAELEHDLARKRPPGRRKTA